MTQCLKLSKAKEKAIKIFADPSTWTTRPILAVKKRNRLKDDNAPLAGVLLDPLEPSAPLDCKYSVYLCSITALPKDLSTFKNLIRQLYKSYEDMVSDGWVLD